jgi:hypothetical protein
MPQQCPPGCTAHFGRYCNPEASNCFLRKPVKSTIAINIQYAEMRSILSQIKQAIIDLGKQGVKNSQIAIAMPNYMAEAFAIWDGVIVMPRLNNKIQSVYGCRVVPNYENNVVVFFEDCHLYQIKPILIPINLQQ